MNSRTVVVLSLLFVLGAAAPAGAQLVGGNLPNLGAPLPSLPGGFGEAAGVVGGVSGLGPNVDRTLRTVADGFQPYRRQARDLLRRHGEAVEADDLGQPVVRGEVTGLGVSADALQRARAAGFQVDRQETIEALGLAVLVLRAPHGMRAGEAVRRLRAMDPAGRYDLNHIYFESGAANASRQPAPTGPAISGEGLTIGLVDGSAAASQPALARVRMTQKPFGPRGARVTAHATAVASLLAGSSAGFHGAAPGASLYVADVYGPTPAGGSAVAVARGLGWLAQMGTPVINISLVGPPNALLEAAVSALVAKGHLLVAAVGNDGPGAAPLYPAAYAGVVGVTGVDARRRVLPEAGRGPQVTYAAPGSDMLAASLDGRFAIVRGASFAAPLAAGRLAQLLRAPDPAGARRALDALSREAIDLGAAGPDPVFGRGLVAADLAVRPAGLAARR